MAEFAILPEIPERVGSTGCRSLKLRPESRENIVGKVVPMPPINLVEQEVNGLNGVQGRVLALIDPITTEERLVTDNGARPLKLPKEMASNTFTNSSRIERKITSKEPNTAPVLLFPATIPSEEPVIIPETVTETNLKPEAPASLDNTGVLFELQTGNTESPTEPAVEESEEQDYLRIIDEKLNEARAQGPFGVLHGESAARIDKFSEPASEPAFDEHGNLVGVEKEYETPIPYTEARIVGTYSPNSEPESEPTIIPVEDTSVPQEPVEASRSTEPGLAELNRLKEKLIALGEKRNAAFGKVDAASARASEADEKAAAAKQEFKQVLGAKMDEVRKDIDAAENAISAAERQAQALNESADASLRTAEFFEGQTAEVRRK